MKIKEMTEEEKAENALKETGRKRKMPQKTNLSHDDNVQYTLHSLDLMSLPPLDIRVCPPEDLRLRCVEYFEMCMKATMKPSFAGFALSLGISRQTLMQYLQDKSKVRGENFIILQQFAGVLNSLAEDYMQNGKINPVAGIFLLKNNFGYKDSQEFVLNNTVQDETTPEGLMEEANLLLEAEPKKANVETE